MSAYHGTEGHLSMEAKKTGYILHAIAAGLIIVGAVFKTPEPVFFALGTEVINIILLFTVFRKKRQPQAKPQKK